MKLDAADREWYAAQRGRRFASWLVLNVTGLAIYYKTDSILWVLIWSATVGFIRFVPHYCELDRIGWQIKREKEHPQ